MKRLKFFVEISTPGQKSNSLVRKQEISKRITGSCGSTQLKYDTYKTDYIVVDSDFYVNHMITNYLLNNN